MGQGIHAGGSRQAGGHGEGQLRVQNRQLGEELGFGKGQLDVVAGIGNNRHLGHLGAGAGGGGNQDRGEQLIVAQQVGAHVVFHAPALHRQDIGHLGGIHDTAAAQADDHVAFFLARQTGAGFYGFNGGVGGHLVEGGDDLDSGLSKAGFDTVRCANPVQDLVRDQQGLAAAKVGGDFL